MRFWEWLSWREPVLLGLVPALLLLLLSSARVREVIRGHRIVALVVALLALAGPEWRSWSANTTDVVVLADRSLSVGSEALTRAEEIAAQLKGLGKHVSVATFGSAARLYSVAEESAQGVAELSAEDRSDLSDGLSLAAALLPEGGDIVLVSDGRYSGRSPVADVRHSAGRGLRVFVDTIVPRRGNDWQITHFSAPQQVVAGQPMPISVSVDAPVAGPIELLFFDRWNGSSRPLARQIVDLKRGANNIGFSLVLPASSGIHVLRAELRAPGDVEPGNDAATTALRMRGQPRVLVINRQGRVGVMAQALGRLGGLDVQVVDARADLTLTNLSGVAAVILENMPLSDLAEGADGALAYFVQEQGGGLLLSGGEQSFAAGGYFRSALEELLPVRIDRQEDRRRPKLAVAIALDRSGSMTQEVASGQTKMALANRSAAEAVELLLPEDQLAVFAVDTAAHEVVPLQQVNARGGISQIRRRVLAIESEGGGIYLATALGASIDSLLRSSAKNRHIIIFADAADAEEPEGCSVLLRNWRAAEGTLSVVALGTPADVHAHRLRMLAQEGGGRIYFVADANNLPRVFAQDMMQVARKTFVKEPTGMLPARGVLALPHSQSGQPPPVGGYNLTFLASGAELFWATADDHAAPLAAGIARGSGKVSALLFEVDGKYTGKIASWPGYRELLRRVTEWTLATQEGTSAFARMSLSGGSGGSFFASIEVSLANEGEALQTPTAIVYPPNFGEPMRVPLRWLSPTTLGARFPLSEAGVYGGEVRVGREVVRLPPVTTPVSVEFSATQDASSGRAMLAEIATVSGGGLYLHATNLVSKGHRRPSSTSLLPILALFLLLLLLGDAAHRRGLWPVWRWCVALMALLRRPPSGARPTGPSASSSVVVGPAGPVEGPPRGDRPGAPGQDTVGHSPAAVEHGGPNPEAGPSVFAQAKQRARRGRPK